MKNEFLSFNLEHSISQLNNEKEKEKEKDEETHN